MTTIGANDENHGTGPWQADADHDFTRGRAQPPQPADDGLGREPPTVSSVNRGESARESGSASRDHGKTMAAVAVVLALPACSGGWSNNFAADPTFTADELAAVVSATDEWHAVGAPRLELTVDDSVRVAELHAPTRNVIVRARHADLTDGAPPDATGEYLSRDFAEAIAIIPDPADPDRARLTALHEIGHALGILRHLDEPGAIMAGVYGSDGLTRADVVAYWGSRRDR